MRLNALSIFSFLLLVVSAVVAFWSKDLWLSGVGLAPDGFVVVQVCFFVGIVAALVECRFADLERRIDAKKQKES